MSDLLSRIEPIDAPEESVPVERTVAKKTTPTKSSLLDRIEPIEEKEDPESLVRTAKDFGIGAGQGLTWDYGDEILGAFEAALTDKTYEQARDEYRNLIKEAKDRSQTATLIGGIVGGIASPVPIPGMGALKGAKSISQAMMGAGKGGLVAGTLQSLGASESDTTKGMLADALSGGVTGAVLSAPVGAASYKLKEFLKGKTGELVKHAYTNARESSKAGLGDFELNEKANERIKEESARVAKQFIDTFYEEPKDVVNQLRSSAKGYPVPPLDPRMSPQLDYVSRKLNRLQSGQSPANLPVDEFTEQFGGDLKQAAEKLKNLASGNTTGRDLTELKGIFKNLTSRNKHIFGGAAKEIADIEQSIPEIKKYNELFTNLNIPFENALKKLPGELLEGEGKFSQSATTRDNFDKLLMDMLSKMKTNKEAGTKLEGVFKTLAKELRETHGVDLYTGEVVDAAKAAAYGLAPRQGNISPAVKDLMPQINKISKDAAVASYRQGYDSHSGFINNVIERLNPKGWGLFGAEVAGDVAGSDIGQKVIKPVANIATKAFNAPSASFQAVASAISKVDPKMAQRLSDAIRSNDKRTINTIMFIVAQNPDMKSIVPVYTPEE